MQEDSQLDINADIFNKIQEFNLISMYPVCLISDLDIFVGLKEPIYSVLFNQNTSCKSIKQSNAENLDTKHLYKAVKTSFQHTCLE